MELSPTQAKSIAFREDIEIVWGRLLESQTLEKNCQLKQYQDQHQVNRV